MTLASTTRSVTYPGTGNNYIFPYTYYVFLSSHLQVTVTSPTNTVTTLALSSDGVTGDYTVSGLLNSAGGNVTLLSNGQAWLTAGRLAQFWSITVARVVPLTQLTNVRGEGRYNPEIHENEYDLLVMALQQINDGLTDLSELQFSNVLPNPLGVANPGIATLASRGDHVHPAVDNATTTSYGLTKLAQSGDANAGIVVQGNDSRLTSSHVPAYCFCLPDTLATTSVFPVIPGQGQNVSKASAQVTTAPTGSSLIIAIRLITRSSGAIAGTLGTITIAATTFTQDITFTSINVPTTLALTIAVTSIGSSSAGTDLAVVVS